MRIIIITISTRFEKVLKITNKLYAYQRDDDSFRRLYIYFFSNLSHGSNGNEIVRNSTVANVDMFCEILCNIFRRTSASFLMLHVNCHFSRPFPRFKPSYIYSLSDILALTSSSLTTLLGLNWLPVDSSCRSTTPFSFVQRMHQCCALTLQSLLSSD